MKSKSVIIYTRFSTEMQRSDSCDDQVRKVREALDRKGIPHRNAIVIRDEAQSGTRDDREGFQRLMALVKQGKVSVIVVDEQSRLSRSGNASQYIQDILYHGARFISVGEGTDTDNEGWELTAKVMELHNSTTIRETGRRVRRGQEGRVLDGNGSAGDYPYGYKSIYENPEEASQYSGRGPKPKKVVQISEEQAAVVRNVFEKFVSGMSLCKICEELNRKGVPTSNKSSSGKWRTNVIRNMLANPKYIGKWSWGTTRIHRNSAGKIKQLPTRNKTDIVAVDRPTLRIIDQDLWGKAQQRLADLNEKYGHKEGQKPRRVRTHYRDEYPKKLLSGLIVCSLCGKPLIYQSRAAMGCPNRLHGKCANATRIPPGLAEEAILEFLRATFSTSDEWVAEAVSAMQAEVKRITEQLPDELKVREDRLAEIRKKIGNLTSVLELGAGELSSIVQRLKVLESEKQNLEDEIADQSRTMKSVLELPDEQWFRQELNNLTDHLQASDNSVARNLIRDMLGEIRAFPVIPEGKQRGWIDLKFTPSKSSGLIRHLLSGKVSSFAFPVIQSCDEICISLRRRTRSEAMAEEIIQMRNHGLTWKEIGQKLRIMDDTASRYYREEMERQKRRAG